MSLSGKIIAILAEENYQDMELHYPRYRLLEEQADPMIIGTGSSRIYTGRYGLPVGVDLDIEVVDASSFDALIIPGGWASDTLRQLQPVLDLVSAMMDMNKIIGCIGQGGWVLSSAKVITGRKLTSHASISDDLIHAGAEWVNNPVVVDGNLITARVPDDLPVFMHEIVEALKR